MDFKREREREREREMMMMIMLNIDLCNARYPFTSYAYFAGGREEGREERER